MPVFSEPRILKTIDFYYFLYYTKDTKQAKKIEILTLKFWLFTSICHNYTVSD